MSHWPERYPKPGNLQEEFSLQLQSNQLILSESWDTIDKNRFPIKIEVTDCICTGVLYFKVDLKLFNDTFKVEISPDTSCQSLREAILEEFNSKFDSTEDIFKITSSQAWTEHYEDMVSLFTGQKWI